MIHPQGWLKIKVYGTLGGVSVVGYNNDCQIISISAKSIVDCRPIIVKRCAFKLGMEMASTFKDHFMGLWLETDASQVVHLDHHGRLKMYTCEIIRSVLDFALVFTCIKVTRIPWEWNYEAHFYVNVNKSICIFLDILRGLYWPHPP